jgi:hypothetical protein
MAGQTREAVVTLPAEQVRQLLAQLASWSGEGLLGMATRARIRQRVLRAGCPLLFGSRRGCSPEPQAPAQVERSRQELDAEPRLSASEVALEAELEQRAERLLAADSNSIEPSFDQQLSEEVAFVQGAAERAVDARTERTDQLAAATAVPLVERVPASVASLPADALESAAEELGEDQPVEAALIERDLEQGRSRWWRLLRPFLYQNALWLAGGLLIVFGSLYFLRSIWDLSSGLWYVAVAALLHAYAGGFFAVGYLLCRREGAQLVGRILFGFTLALLPLGSVAAGEVVAAALRHGGAGLALALLAMTLALAAQGLMLAVLGGIYERKLAAPLTRVMLLFAAVTSSLAALWELAPRLISAALVVGLALLAWGLRSLVSRPVVLRGSLLAAGAAFLWSLVVLVGRAELAAQWASTHLAPVLAVCAWLLLDADRRLRARAGLAPRVSVAAIALYGALLMAPMIALVGLAQRGYFDLIARIVVLLSALPATAGLAQGAWRHGRRALTLLAATTGLLTFFFLPAPFKGALGWAREALRGALGYQQAPLPLAYYGVAFLPYLVALLWLAGRLRHKRPDLVADLQRFCGGLAVLLLPMAASAYPDLRPMLWTWPAYALGAIWVARSVDARWLPLAAQGLLVGWLLVLGRWLAVQGLPLGGLAAAIYGLGSAIMLVRAPARWRETLAFGVAGAAAVTLAVTLALGLQPPLIACAGLPIAAAALALVCWRYDGSVWAYAAMGALAVGLAMMLGGTLALEPRQLAVFAALIALICIISATWLRDRGSRLGRLFAAPLARGGLLALSLAIIQANGLIWVGLLAVVVSLTALLLWRDRWDSYLASTLLLVALAAATSELSGLVYPLLLLGACGLLTLALVLPRHWADRRARRRAWVGVAYLAGPACAVGALLTALRPLNTGLLASSCGALALYAGLCAALLGVRVLAHLAALCIAVGALAGLIALDASALQVTLALFGLAAMTLIVALRFGARGAADPLYRLVGAPAATLIIVLLATAWSLSLGGAPLVGGSLVLALTLPVVLGHRAAWATALVSVVAAAAAVQLGTLVDLAWPLGLAAVALLLLAVAPHLPSVWPNAQRRRSALGGAALGAQAVALVGALWHAWSTPRPAPWLLAAAASLALFALFGSALVMRRRRLAVAARLIGGAAAAAAALAALKVAMPAAPISIYVAVLASTALPWLWLARRSLTGSGWLALALATVAQLPLWALALAVLIDGPGVVSILAVALLGGGRALAAGAIVVIGASAMVWSWLPADSDAPSRRWAGALLWLGSASGAIALGAAAGLNHATLPLAAVALLIGWRWRGSIGWPLALAGLGLLASHGQLARPEMALGLATVAAVFFARWRRAPSSRDQALIYGGAIALMTALQAVALFVAATFSSGRHPASAVLPLLAGLALVSGVALRHLGCKLSAARRVGAWTTAMALPLAAAGLLGCGLRAPTFAAVAAQLTLLITALYWAVAATRERQPWAGRLALVALCGAYFAARVGSGALAGVEIWLDAVVVVVAGPAALASLSRLPEGLREAARAAAMLIPLAASLLLASLAPAAAALVLLLVAAHYAVAARQLAIKHLGVLALLAANASLLLAYVAGGWQGPLLYTVPTGITLLGLSHLYQAELPARSRWRLRLALLVGLYGSSVAIACSSISPLAALTVVPLLCVGGIVLGTLLRVRLYLLLGVVFLAIDLLANMLRYGLAHRALGALFLTGLGLAVVGAMALFTLRRERILRRYSSFLGDLRGWE